MSNYFLGDYCSSRNIKFSHPVILDQDDIRMSFLYANLKRISGDLGDYKDRKQSGNLNIWSQIFTGKLAEYAALRFCSRDLGWDCKKGVDIVRRPVHQRDFDTDLIFLNPNNREEFLHVNVKSCSNADYGVSFVFQVSGDGKNRATDPFVLPSQYKTYDFGCFVYAPVSRHECKKIYEVGPEAAEFNSVRCEICGILTKAECGMLFKKMALPKFHCNKSDRNKPYKIAIFDDDIKKLINGEQLSPTDYPEDVRKSWY